VANERREFVGVTTSIDALTMMSGYMSGRFPMAAVPGVYEWWSPDPRAVLPLENLRVTRSLRQSMRRFRVSVDEAFDSVVAHCADPRRPGGWMDAQLAQTYRQLHTWGLAHSVEAWDGDGVLAGGLFTVNIGGFVAGESMFHIRRDASKVALVGLVERLRQAPGPVLLDTQWRTEHLASLGVVDVHRRDYMKALRAVIEAPNVM
jgi:leucyl/phenylalanyl-tRNA--protein transferase